ncbi:uncharacterized protein LOC136093739 [Hydra vulgaris]|uniref:uncharacterized protein LOC136093739 n=1 Tax=Hydra vulgaris TaxID=6087 RepID=UPI0032E9E091
MYPDRDLKWTDELANELHKPVIKHFRKRKVISNGIDEIWAADLVDMQPFSKFNDDRKCTKLLVDKDLDFYNKHFKALEVQLYLTKNEEKSCLVERWNRTMKQKMFKYTTRWTEEVFTIPQVQYTDPPTYKITDHNGEEIQGTFYEQELQKTKQEIFKIEKVIRKQGNKSLAKWYGYSDTFNS